jgi:cytochrome c oxidase subunit II
MHDAYVVVAIIAVLIVVAINAALIMAALRARQGGPVERTEEGMPSPPPSRVPQRRVTAALSVLAIAVFVIGVIYNERAREAPSPLAGNSAAPLSVRVAGQQWLWRYTYPDGTFSYYELVVPVGRTVRLKIDSTDVVHRWFVPELDGMAEAVPGRLNQISFRADRPGVYDGQSTAFSGSSYAAMRIRVRAVDDAEYKTWLATQGKDLLAAQKAVQKALGEPAGAATTPSASGTPGVAKVQPGGQS